MAINSKKSKIAGEDYAANMFKNGNNRAENNPKVKNAPSYNSAAQNFIEQTEGGMDDSFPRDTFHSREGTDASGLYDESGGPVGGTEEELDDLESEGAPVDRNPRMKE